MSVDYQRPLNSSISSSGILSLAIQFLALFEISFHLFDAWRHQGRVNSHFVVAFLRFALALALARLVQVLR